MLCKVINIDYRYSGKVTTLPIVSELFSNKKGFSTILKIQENEF